MNLRKGFYQRRGRVKLLTKITLLEVIDFRTIINDTLVVVV